MIQIYISRSFQIDCVVGSAFNSNIFKKRRNILRFLILLDLDRGQYFVCNIFIISYLRILKFALNPLASTLLGM